MSDKSEYEDEIKSLVKTVVWNTIANRADYVGMKLPHGDFVDELMDDIADEVYSVIWEYLSDPA